MASGVEVERRKWFIRPQFCLGLTWCACCGRECADLWGWQHFKKWYAYGEGNILFIVAVARHAISFFMAALKQNKRERAACWWLQVTAAEIVKDTSSAHQPRMQRTSRVGLPIILPLGWGTCSASCVHASMRPCVHASMRLPGPFCCAALPQVVRWGCSWHASRHS